MREAEKLSLEQIRAFLESSEPIRFEDAHRSEVYEWIGSTLWRQQYREQGKEARGLIRQYLMKLSGLSRSSCWRCARRDRSATILASLAPCRRQPSAGFLPGRFRQH